jgi:hypothetical protein
VYSKKPSLFFSGFAQAKNPFLAKSPYSRKQMKDWKPSIHEGLQAASSKTKLDEGSVAILPE